LVNDNYFSPVGNNNCRSTLDELVRFMFTVEALEDEQASPRTGPW